MGFGYVISVKGMEGAPAKLERFRLKVLDMMPTMLSQVGAEVARISTEDYLSGRRPQKLGRVSGDLARSIGSRAAPGGVNRITGNTITIGTNLVYARAHEQGFQGSVNVSAHDRRMKVVFGRYRGSILQHVSAHSRMMNIKPRPFLSTALHDSKKVIPTIIQNLMKRALREAMG